MRIYSSVYDLFTETIREVFARGMTTFDPTVQGIRVERETHEMKEVFGYTYKLTKWRDLEKSLDWWSREFNKPHVSYETAERWAEDMFKPLNPDTWWRGIMDDYWKKYSTLLEWGRFEYTYGQRLASQIPMLINSILRNPYARGHVITVWYPQDIESLRRKPCTLSYQYLFRPQKSYLVVYQRSCDLVNFFPLDLAKAIIFSEKLLNIVNEELIRENKEKLKIDAVLHFIGSLHAYKIDTPPHLRW